MRKPIFAALFLITLAGCGNTPARNGYISVEAGTQAINAVSDAYELKLISKPQMMAIKPYKDAVVAAQTKIDSDLASGNYNLTTDFSALTGAVNALLVAESKAKTATTTQP